MGWIRYVAFVFACLLARPASGQAVLDVAAVPGLGAAGQASYANFLLMNLPRAFAVGSKGAYGWYGGSGTAEAAAAKAIESCASKGATDCGVYADGLDVVWQGRPRQGLATPGAFTSTWNYAIVPDNRYFWRGPAAAAGIYVWGHGLGSLNGSGALADARGTQPQAHVRAFNNAGFDVVRFDREPHADDRERAAGWLADSLADLRRRGYRMVVVGGQSRGGWNGLQMLTHAGLADVVVAVSPAAHGQGGSTNLTAQYDDLRQLVGDVAPSRTRLVFVQFKNDPYAGDPSGRVALIERLRGRLGGLLVIDGPQGFSGHFGGNTAAFSERYAACIYRFATAVPGAAGC